MMDLSKIREALNSGNPEMLIRRDILDIISRDEEALPDMIKLLAFERERKRNLILEINMQLSRAHIALQAPLLNKDGFVIEEISKFYQTNKEQLSHCYKELKSHG